MIRHFDNDIRKTVIRNNLDGKFLFIWFVDGVPCLTEQGLTITDCEKAIGAFDVYVKRLVSGKTKAQITERG